MPLFFKKNAGFITILILSSLPVLRWLEIVPLNTRFSSISSITTSLGQIAGLVGITLISINLILSSRLKIVDKLFHGIDKAYGYHAKIGAIAFSLLLFHPLLLSFKYILISVKSAALFFIPFKDIPTTYGIAALFLMIILVVLTFYIRMEYQNWKISHKLMVAVSGLVILHALFIPSDISRDNILRFFILGLAFLGFGAGFYRAFLSRFLNNNLQYRVGKITDLNYNTTGIELIPQNKALKFTPGQFIFISFLGKGISRESHPFSLTSRPQDGNLKLVIKSLGDFTKNLKNLKPGDLALIDGPFGSFSFKSINNKNQIWVAGGIGITPFLSMVRSLRNDGYDIDLYYCANNEKDTILLKELLEIGAANPKIKIFPWYSEEKGFISGEAISKASNGLENKDIFLCGPPVFMEKLKEQFLGMKVGLGNIHFEKFNFR